MYLIDAQNENSGSTDNSDTTEYKVRTLGILNNLIDDVYPASDTFAIGEDGKRPALDDLTSFSDEIKMDPYIVRSVLPCGLAAKLLSEENPTLADFSGNSTNSASPRRVREFPPRSRASKTGCRMAASSTGSLRDGDKRVVHLPQMPEKAAAGAEDQHRAQYAGMVQQMQGRALPAHR